MQYFCVTMPLAVIPTLLQQIWVCAVYTKGGQGIKPRVFGFENWCSTTELCPPSTLFVRKWADARGIDQLHFIWDVCCVFCVVPMEYIDATILLFLVNENIAKKNVFYSFECHLSILCSSDLWALGCIIFQFLSGETPFRGG